MDLQYNKRFLGIDYGTKRIGLALCDPLKTFAYAFKTLTNDTKTFKELEKVIKEQGIEKIILGLPLKENGDEALITKQVLEFKKNWKKIFLWKFCCAMKDILPQ